MIFKVAQESWLPFTIHNGPDVHLEFSEDPRRHLPHQVLAQSYDATKVVSFNDIQKINQFDNFAILGSTLTFSPWQRRQPLASARPPIISMCVSATTPASQIKSASTSIRINNTSISINYISISILANNSPHLITVHINQGTNAAIDTDRQALIKLF